MIAFLNFFANIVFVFQKRVDKVTNPIDNFVYDYFKKVLRNIKL